MAAKPQAKKTTTKTTKPRTTRRRKHVALTHDAIALRAYELYVANAEGDDVAHWLQAERELTVT